MILEKVTVGKVIALPTRIHLPHRGTIHEESYQNRKMASKTSKTAPQGVPPSPRRLSGALWFAITAAREKMGQLEAE